MIIVMILFKVKGRNLHLPVWHTVSAFTWEDGEGTITQATIPGWNSTQR